jgi:hypothetical protein
MPSQAAVLAYLTVHPLSMRIVSPVIWVSFIGTIDSESWIPGTHDVKEGTILGDFTFTACRME